MRLCVLGNSGRLEIARCILDCLNCSSSRRDEKSANNQLLEETTGSNFGKMMMAMQTDTVIGTNLSGIEVHGKSIRVAFMHKGVRHRHTLGTKSNKAPAPFSYQEYNALLSTGCLPPVDAASVTLAAYTGLRPGELCGLAVQDIATDRSKLTVRRSATQSLTFKIQNLRVSWVVSGNP